MFGCTNTLRCALALAAGLIAAVPAVGAHASAAPAARWADLADVVFQHIGRDSELPNGAVATALAEDGDGFLWIGSQNGLSRWDGYHFQNFRSDPERSGALPDNFIKTLYTDSRGRLWIGTTSGGLARYDRDQERFIAYPVGPGGLSHVSIRALAEDGAGGMWVATEGGLDHIESDSGAITHLRHVDGIGDSLPDNRVRALLRGRNGTLWVGTVNGLVRLDRGATRFVPVPLPAAPGKLPSAWSFFEDSAGRIWIGTVRNGAYVIEPGETTAHAVLESDATQSELQNKGVHTILEVRPGEVWLGTMGYGIVAIDVATSRTRRIRHDATLQSSLADDAVQALLQDRAGLIWVCTDRGISRHDPKQAAAVAIVFGASNRKEGISDIDIDAVLPMPDGRVWLGLGNNGVDILDPQGMRVDGMRPDPKRPQEALPGDYVNAFAASPAGTVYVGTEQGLYRVNQPGNAVARLKVPGRDPSAPVWALLLQNEVLWIGGLDGLWGIKIGKDEAIALVRQGSIGGLTDERVKVIVPGPDDSLWVGTKHGLNRYDVASQAIDHILPDPSDRAALSGGYISSLLTDAEGRLWVGTQGGGINVLESLAAHASARFHRIGVAQGLPNDDINKLLPDPQGRVWASTDDGLAIIDPKSFAVRALRRAEGVAISSYWVGSGATTAQGELLFGGSGGLVIVRPERLTQWTYNPPIVVTDVRIGGRRVPANRFNGSGSTEPLTVMPNANSIAIEFSALDYSGPERNRYAYRLDGFDADWVETEPTRRVATYTNLAPGKYALHLRGSNRDGVWTGNTTTVPIRVLPAWYQTLAFKFAAGLIASALLATLLQARTAYLRRRQHELELQILDRTAELRHSQRRLEQIAYLDDLTTLPNRRRFTVEFRNLLAATQRSGGRFALLLIDLDRFKQINDTFGHDVGDALLIETANRLKAATRTSDCTARLGGDEFAVLLTGNPDAAAIDAVCQRIMAGLRADMPFVCAEVKASASVGVAVFPDHGATEEQLYKAADLALYDAKRAGRSAWRWFQPATDTHHAEDETLQNTRATSSSA
jgi:diguanylate cyclase (GGDEF)-like protein